MRAQAFTLIELMIVVAIIGILAAIAIPNFGKFQCKSKQTEAKSNLKLIQVAEEAYRAENDSYLVAGAAQLNIISVIFSGKLRYTYSITGPNPKTSVVGAAVGNPEMLNDLWKIEITNTTAAVTNLVDGCQNF